MKQRRQSKIVAILALCVSVLGLTLGFAAFSNTLTISSSATVSPEETDFNVNVYGVESWNGVEGYPAISNYTSSSLSVPFKGINSQPAATSAVTAKITDSGKNITISDISVGLSEPGQTASYFFLIKNEGQYDVYLDLLNGYDEIGMDNNGTCTAGTGSSNDLVQKACTNILLLNTLTDSTGQELFTGSYVKIPKGDYLKLETKITYSETIGGETPRADGDFSVTYDDIIFNFTSVPPEE